jgi:hypothetical protein
MIDTLARLGLGRRTAGLAFLVGASLTMGPISCARKQAGVEERPEERAEARPDTLNLDGLRESIARQVGTAACSSPTVCRTLPMGAKPCGGPRKYLVYSVSTSDSARLAVDVARYSQAEARLNEEKGLVSDCSAVVKPEVSCVSGRCVAMESERRLPQ